MGKILMLGTEVERIFVRPEMIRQIQKLSRHRLGFLVHVTPLLGRRDIQSRISLARHRLRSLVGDGGQRDLEETWA